MGKLICLMFTLRYLQPQCEVEGAVLHVAAVCIQHDKKSLERCVTQHQASV